MSPVELGEASDGGEDLIGGFGPHKRLGVRVLRIDEFADRGFELGHAAVCAAAQLFVRQLRKPALDQIEPGPVRGREVHVEPRPFGQQPVANQGRFVRPVVIHDEMDVQFPRHGRIDGIEKMPKLCGSMAPMKLTDHRARLHVERGKQHRGAVAFVVMRAPFGLSRSHRQQRLGAVPTPESAISRRHRTAPRARAGSCTTRRCRGLSRSATDHSTV